MTIRPRPLIVAAALVALIGSAPAFSQVPQGTISGVIRDTTGAVVPGAIVTATNQATNASQTATTGCRRQRRRRETRRN